MNFKELVLRTLEEAKIDINLQSILDLNLPSSETEWLKSLKEYDPHLIDTLWIAKNWLTNKVDTFQEIRDQVTMFYKGRKRNMFNGSEKDIKTHKDYNKFKILIGSKTAGKTMDTRKSLHNSIKPIYEDSNIVLYNPTNKEQSIALSHGHPAFDSNHYTFCVGAEGASNLWKEYTSDNSSISLYANVFYFIRFKKRDSSIATGVWGDKDNPIKYKDDKHILVLNMSPVKIEETFADNNTQETSKQALLNQFPELSVVEDLLVPGKKQQEHYTANLLNLLNRGEIPQDYTVIEDEGVITNYMQACLKDKDLLSRVISNILNTPYNEVIELLERKVSQNSFKQLIDCFELHKIFSKYINDFKQKLKNTQGVVSWNYDAHNNFSLLKGVQEMISHMIVKGSFFSTDNNKVIPGFAKHNGRVSESFFYNNPSQTSEQIATQNLIVNLAGNKAKAHVHAIVVEDTEITLANAQPNFNFKDSILGGDVILWWVTLIPETFSQVLEEIIKTLPKQIGGELYLKQIVVGRPTFKKLDQNIVETNVSAIKEQARNLYNKSYENVIDQAKAYWAQV